MESWKSLLEITAAAVLVVDGIIKTVSAALAKLHASPHQRKIKATCKALLMFSPALLSFGAFIFKFYDWAAVLWFSHMLISVGRFLRLPGPPTRREIVFEALFPVAFFIILLDYLT